MSETTIPLSELRRNSVSTVVATSGLMVAMRALGQANRKCGAKPRPHMP
jgi:hypothetical protein